MVPLVGGAACQRQRSRPPLSNTFGSPEDLGRAVLRLLLSRDLAGLRTLALTRDEFEAWVWPRLPASRPERNMPMDFVWDRLHQRSELSLAATMARHGGHPMSLDAVLFEGETTDYVDFLVRRDTVLVVRTADNVVEKVRLFGSLLTMGDRHKVFSFVVD